MTHHRDETEIYDTIVLAKDAEGMTITFKAPDGRELVFPHAHDWFKVGDVGCLILRERDGKPEFSFPTYPDRRLRRWPTHDTQSFADLEDDVSRAQLWAWRLVSDDGALAADDQPLLVRCRLSSSNCAGARG